MGIRDRSGIFDSHIGKIGIHLHRAFLAHFIPEMRRIITTAIIAALTMAV